MVLATLAMGKADCWATTLSLYTSMMMSVLLHSSALWGIEYLDILKIKQLEYFKMYLFLPRSTRALTSRLELGIDKVVVKAVGQAFNWLQEVLEMPKDRLPRRCLNKLLRLANNPVDNIPRYNWISQLNTS
uniref:Uncharacterized protein n=1 Tax=Bracon brevicornis TaxID=1563983 RepID=A0A6V7J2A6_9HYME